MARKHATLRNERSCVFCAGQRLATSVDHVPSRFLFKMKDRPKGLEVPACTACNNGSSWTEDLAAMLAAIHLTNPDPDHFQKRFDHLLRSNFAAVLELYPTWDQEISSSKWLDEQGEQHWALNLTGPIVQEAMLLFGAKLGMALHWHETKQILSANGQVGVIWFSNEQALDRAVPRHLFELLPEKRTLRQGRKNVGDQFTYSSKATIEPGSSAHWAIFGEAYAYNIFVSENFSLSSLHRDNIRFPGCLANSRPIATVLNRSLWPSV